MIHNLGIENFRVFKNFKAFKLNDFTILTGANNSGKSTLNKILFLLKNSIYLQDGEPILDRLVFNQDVISRLGTFSDNISYFSDNQSFSLAFVIEDQFWKEVQITLTFSISETPQEALLSRISAYKYTPQGLTPHISTFDQVSYASFLKANKTVLTNEDIEHLAKNRDFVWSLSPIIKEQNQQLDIAIVAYEQLHNLLWQSDKMGHLIKIYSKLRNNLTLLPFEEAKKKEYDNLLGNELIPIRNIGNSNSHQSVLDITPWVTWDNKQQKPIDLPNKLEAYSEQLSDMCDVFLIPTRLSILVAGQIKLFTGDDIDKNLIPLRELLNKEGVTSLKIFFNEYHAFELHLISTLISSSIPEATSSNKAEYYTELKAKLDFRNFFFRKSFNEDSIFHVLEILKQKGSKIARILLNSYYVETLFTINKLYSTSESNKNQINKTFGQHMEAYVRMYDRPVSFDEELKEVSNNISSIYRIIKSPITTLVKEIQQLTENMYFSWQNYSIKRHFLFSEIQNDDSPFLDFATQCLRNTNTANFKKQFINRWLREFEIGDELIVETIKTSSSTIGVEYSIKTNGKLHPLNDNSVGVNMLLLLIIRIVAAPQKSTLILEEPEANLHPAFQSKLAELLADAHQHYGTRFIVETHSEYFIRKLQLLTAIYNKQKGSEDFKGIKMESHKLSIYYFYHPDKIPENRKQVEQLEIREDGILKQGFGEGFFDHATKLAYELITLQSLN